MLPLDELLKEFVTPRLKGLGYRKSGRIYSLRSERGDYALIQFDPFNPTPGQFGFGVTYAAAPVPYTGWLLRIANPQEVSDDVRKRYNLWSQTLYVPGVDLRDPRAHPDHWHFELGDRQDFTRCGTLLIGAIEELVVPLLPSLLDRDYLLRQMRNADDPLWSHENWHLVQRDLRFLLLVDEEPGEELEAGLRVIEGEGDPIGFAAWARSWIAARAAGA